MKNITAIYPGTFDPPTYGHLDVIKRASRIFGGVIVAVAEGTGKGTWFGADERVLMLKKITENLKNVKVDSFAELLINYVKKQNAKIIIRGLRVLSDFEYELQMALTNTKMAPDIETVFMMTHEKYSYLSSSLIKEIYLLGGDVGEFVPLFVKNKLKDRIKNENRHKKDNFRRTGYCRK